MAISLPSTSAMLASEYAATSINLGRNLQPNADGHLVPNYSAQIAYSRQDFVVDADGNKLNIVQRTMTPMAMPQPDVYSGWVNLSHAELTAMGGAGSSATLLDAIADGADALVQADLIKRGILN